jgi:hypothetical protein
MRKNLIKENTIGDTGCDILAWNPGSPATPPVILII